MRPDVPVPLPESASPAHLTGTTQPTDNTGRPALAEPSGLIVCPDGRARPDWATRTDTLRTYYDTEWGMPVRDEQGLFERLSLEVFQCGLSWATVLNKRQAFREAFRGFNPDAVASFAETDVAQLLENPGIIRNRRKISATITNAAATIAVREHGGLPNLIWSFQPDTTPAPFTAADVPSQSPESVALAAELKKHGFAFVGPTTMFALMEAIGMVDTHLVGSHRRGSSGIWT